MTKWTFEIFGHEPTGLFIAKSDDVKGVIVHGHTLEEIKKNIPAALSGYFEALGQKLSLSAVKDDDSLPEGFFPRNLIAEGSLTGIAA